MKNKGKTLLVIGLIMVVVLGGFGYNWYTDRINYVTTDNAKITGDIINASSKISGKVAEVKVTSGAKVKKGDVLFTLETDQAQAQLNQAQAQLNQTQAAVDVAQAGLDAARAGLDAANSKLSSTNAGASNKDIAALEGPVKVAKRSVKVAQDSVKVAQANYDLIKLNLDTTQIKAPMDGTIVQVNIHVGDNITPGQGAISLVDFSKLYVTAYVLENDLEKVKVDENVKLSVDAFSGVTFNGKVKEVGLATASVFSLFSSDNASGNFTKVSQRIPVKIEFDAANHTVIPGMSTTAKIKIAK